MKPKVVSGRTVGESMASVHEDYDDISLDKAYETVGLLITESRLPDVSSKGRRDGEHILQNGSTHKACSESNEECQKVRRYKEIMGGLCRNGIPLCVEVLLCPSCEIEYGDSEKTTATIVHHTHEVGSAHSNCYVLLEQWTIQQVCTRVDSKPQTLQNLCNAVRSHLCFSQLSAWLQVSQGVTPKHVFYRLTAPGEWFVHKFVMSPQNHKFPDASLGRPRSALRVTLSSLPRTALTPYEISIASRDKLFGVKDASPLLRKSRSSFTNITNTSGEHFEQDGGPRSLTPNERTHCRSKSVRGLQDLTGRKSAAESKYHPGTSGAQRCLKYLDDAEISPVSTLSAAERLASFSALPTNSINNLELISCTTGNSLAKVPPPTRLSISSQKCSSLKSPKVLFTRTAVKDYFTVPSLESSIDFDFSSDSDSTSPDKPSFELGDKDSRNSRLKHQSESHKRLENISDISGSRDELIAPVISQSSQQSNMSVESASKEIGLNVSSKSDVTQSCDSRLREPSFEITHKKHSNVEVTPDHCSSSNDTTQKEFSDMDIVTKPSKNGHSLTNKGTETSPRHCSNGVSKGHGHYNGIITANNGKLPDLSNESSAVSRDSSEYCSTDVILRKKSTIQSQVRENYGGGALHTIENLCEGSLSSPTITDVNSGYTDTAPCTRKSRKHFTPELHSNANGQISNTPINKKLQNIKQSQSCPQPSRPRMFKQRPLQSSPAPVKRIGRNNFGYDENITSVEAIKNAISCTSLSEHCQQEGEKSSMTLSSSAPAFTSSNRSQTTAQSRSSLLGNFEESLLNCRIDPAGVVDGFTVDIGASGSFCPKHVSLPVEAYFFNSLSDDDAPSPYLGYVDLSQISRRGYQIPRKGTLQITLFYPNHKVNKMFVVTYDHTDMPAKSQTFIRQKTVYAPCEQQQSSMSADTQVKATNSSTALCHLKSKLPTYLRYLIHLRFLSTKTNKIFLHTDIRLIYARDRFEFDPKVASYELRSFIEAPSDPKYSPLK